MRSDETMTELKPVDRGSRPGRIFGRPLSSVIALLLTLLLPALSGAQQFQFEPGATSAFEIKIPALARAGERVSVVITARDAQGNVVTNYAAVGGGVTLSLTSAAARPFAGAVEPNRFPASAFRDGVLAADLVFARAGVTELEVTDAASRVSSRSSRVEIRPGSVATVRVTAPTEARVGEAFDLAIEVYDRFGNPVADYDAVGADVTLRPATAGSVGRIEPERVPAALFQSGRAAVRVRYSQAENLSIVAEAPPARGVSDAVAVRAGALHAFTVTVPSRRVIAGEPFGIAIEAKDASGNTITDYNRVGAVVALRTTGSARLEPSSIPPTAFSSGVAMVNVRYTAAEAISVIAEDPTGTKRGQSAAPIEVLGGRLGRIEVIPAENARAGAPLAVQVLGYDVYGNLIRDYGDRAVRISLTSADASALEAPVLTAAAFSEGAAFVTVTPVKAGTLVVQAVDEATGAGGRSAPVRVRAGSVAGYAVRAPLTVVAHEPFEVEITALDRFGNVIDDYNRIGAGLVVSKSGSGEIVPAAIAPSAFENGVARVRFTSNTAEEMTLTLQQQGGTARGQSGSILVTHSTPRRYRVVAPSQAVAGDPVRVQLAALDEFGNPVVGYSAMNRSLTLYAENGDPVAPPLLLSAVFNRGVAEVDAVFFRTGDAVLVAEELGGTVMGKSSVVRVVPSRPAQLVVSSATEAEAGTPLTVRVEMRDRMGNRIRDYSPGASSLSVRVLGQDGAVSEGALSLGDIRNMVFREGLAEVNVLPQTAAPIVIEVTDELLSVKGRSPLVTIRPGPVDRFVVQSLTQDGMRAGEPTRLRITALDAFGNPVTTYGRDGSGARILARPAGAASSAGQGVFLPSTLMGSAFQGGVAEVYTLYDRAEGVEITVERAAPGVLLRPEVVSAVVSERSGGALVSILGNAPLARGEVRRLTESLYEVNVAGALLAGSGGRVSRATGIVSLVTLSQTEDGVRVLIHATGPAVVRAGQDANRIVIDVDPVLSGAMPREPLLIPAQPVPTGASVGTAPGQGSVMPAEAARAGAPTMADVDRLVRENRFGEALGLVKIMLGTRPDDPTLVNLKRRLELLSTLVPAAPPAPSPTPVAPSPVAPPALPATRDFVPLQQPVSPVENLREPARSGMAAVEAAVRAGKYREALTQLDQHLATNPSDAAAVRMRQRIEQMLRILEGNAPGTSR
jgi:hypothetical protein